MTNQSLCDFVGKTIRKNRIGFGDVRRLQRDILADGIASRADVESLIALDRGVGRADPAWAEYLVTAVVDFVVWGARPTGYVDADTADWLATSLSAGGLTRTGRLIAREVVREAEAVERTLLPVALGEGSACPMALPPAPVPEPASLAA